MNNIGKRVKIKDYCSNYNGKTGVITEEKKCTFYVKLDDGTICQPYNLKWHSPECELIEEEFVLPEKWMVIRNSLNAAILNKWNNDKYHGGENRASALGTGVMYSDKMYTIEPMGDYTEITFEQFKQYVLKENKTNMEKKIIGYKLVKPEYEQAAIAITTYSDDGKFKEYMLKSTGNFVKRLKKANVLDLWFEPVYENLEEIKVGDFFMCTEEICSRNGKLNKLYKCIKTSENQIFYESHSSIAKERCKKATAGEIKKFTFVDIKGYQAIMKNGMIEFGCQSFSKKFFLVYIIYSKEMLLHLNVILITQN